MEIYIVQPGDDIYSIAGKYHVSAEKLIQDNQLVYPYDLVTGQTIVIVYPKQTHTVQEGDTLSAIADLYGITPMQLLRLNPSLSERQYIYPGEIITISYDTIGKITVNGFTYPYIQAEVLHKVLPNLTYLSVFNYMTKADGGLITYYDDAALIQTAKNYGVIPLMMTTTLSARGVPNIETGNQILLSAENQNRHIEHLLNTIKAKGYAGINMTFNYMNTTNQSQYNSFSKRVADRMHQEGYLFFVTINVTIKNKNGEVIFEKIDLTEISKTVDGLIALQFIWGRNHDAPAPVSSIRNLKTYIDYILPMVPPNKLIAGKSLVSYDWLLPFIPGKTIANSLTINSALSLARDTDAIIQFDDISQTPFFYYTRSDPEEHIVWSVDARSIQALAKLLIEDGLNGTGFWNIMDYYSQLWLVLNAQFDIERKSPETIT